MGLIARVLSFVRTQRDGARVSDVKADSGGGPNVLAEHYQPSGRDAHPLPGDYAYLADSSGRGRQAAVGYIDPLNEQTAGAGEVREYGRDPETGAIVVQGWLKADGSYTLYNSLGRLTLRADGEFNINGVRITRDGDVITSEGVSLRRHPHDQGADSDGDTQQATHAPTATG